MLLTGTRAGALFFLAPLSPPAMSESSSSGISIILRTGDRGAYGDSARVLSGDVLSEPLFSSRASTSCRSMSSIASMLMGRWGVGLFFRDMVYACGRGVHKALEVVTKGWESVRYIVS